MCAGHLNHGAQHLGRIWMVPGELVMASVSASSVALTSLLVQVDAGRARVSMPCQSGRSGSGPGPVVQIYAVAAVRGQNAAQALCQHGASLGQATRTEVGPGFHARSQRGLRRSSAWGVSQRAYLWSPQAGELVRPRASHSLGGVLACVGRGRHDEKQPLHTPQGRLGAQHVAPVEAGLVREVDAMNDVGRIVDDVKRMDCDHRKAVAACGRSASRKFAAAPTPASNNRHLTRSRPPPTWVPSRKGTMMCSSSAGRRGLGVVADGGDVARGG